MGGAVALITMSCVVFLDSRSGSIAGSMILALSIGLAIGIIQGFLVAYLKIQPFIVTLAGMFFTRGMTTIVSSAPHTATNEAFLALKNFSFIVPGIGSYGKSGNFIPARIEPGVIIAFVIVLAVWAILKWTRFDSSIKFLLHVLHALHGNATPCSNATAQREEMIIIHMNSSEDGQRLVRAFGVKKEPGSG